MWASAERVVIADVCSVPDELVALREAVGVAGGRRIRHGDGLILGYAAAAELDVVASSSGETSVGREQAEVFLDCRRYQTRILPQLLLDLRLLAQMDHHASEEDDWRDHPDDDELTERPELQLRG